MQTLQLKPRAQLAEKQQAKQHLIYKIIHRFKNVTAIVIKMHIWRLVNYQ